MTWEGGQQKIVAIHNGQVSFIVGQGDITRIVVYEEAGEMGLIPWLAIYMDIGVEKLKYRVAAREWMIEYED